MSNTETEWQGNYQISAADQANESRRVGSGRHRSNMHPQQQQQGGHGHQVSSSRHHQRSKYPVQAVPGQHPGQHPQYMQGMPQQQQPQQPRGPMVAPTTGEIRSGHIEVDTLYGGGAGQLRVNSMNAPNNSTMQCGCENIDCPFCNLMMSVQMSS